MSTKAQVTEQIFIGLQQVMSKVHNFLFEPHDQLLSVPADYFTWKKHMISAFKTMGGYVWPFIDEGKFPDAISGHINEEKFKEQVDEIVSASIRYCVKPKFHSRLNELDKGGLALWKAIEETYGTPSIEMSIFQLRKLMDSRSPTEDLEDASTRILELLDFFYEYHDANAQKAHLLLLFLNEERLTEKIVRGNIEVNMVNVRKIMDGQPTLAGSSTDQLSSARENSDELALSTFHRKSDLKYRIQKTPYKSRFNHSRAKCDVCKKVGHIARNCRYAKNNSQDEPFRQESGFTFSEVEMSQSIWIGTIPKEEKMPLTEWVFDTGATRHVCGDISLAYDIKPADVSIMGVGGVCFAPFTGSVDFLISSKTGRKIHFTCKDVLVVPELKRNLFSASVATKGGCMFHVKENHVIADWKGEELEFATKSSSSKLYLCDMTVVKRADPKSSVEAFLAKPSSKSDLWHKRLCHASPGVLMKIRENLQLSSSDIAKCNSLSCTGGCLDAKASALPFKPSVTRSKHVIQTLHMDVCGPMSPAAWDGSRYFLTIIDDKSRYVKVFLLRNKSEAAKNIIEFVAYAETHHFGYRVCNVRSDNGGEFTSAALEEFFRNKGIVHQLTVPYTPQQNGVAERMNRTLLEKAKAILHRPSLPKYLWNEAIQTAAYVHNILPSKTHNSIPYKLWTGNKPIYSHLKVFGCSAVVTIPSGLRTKLASNVFRGIMVGYGETRKAYRIFVRGRVVEARSVIFNEDSPYHIDGFEEIDEDNFGQPNGIQPQVADIKAHEHSKATDIIPVGAANGEDSRIPLQNFTTSKPSSSITSHSTLRKSSRLAISQRGEERETFTSSQPSFQDAVIISSDESDGEGYPSDHGYKATQLSKCNFVEVIETQPILQSPTSTSDTFIGLTAETYDKDKYERRKTLLLTENIEAALIGDSDSLTYNQAMNSVDAEHWKSACNDEIKALTENDTWTLVDLPTGSQAIGSKWVFKIKRHTDGSIERYKARLVVQGFKQIEGIDFKETFAPVVRYETVRILLAVAAHNNLDVHQMDVTTAFLNGDLKETIYMKQPKGYETTGQEDKVCLLKKSLYGLKQAPLCWNEKMGNQLRILGFSRNESDYGLYSKGSGNDQILLALYVDDILIATKSKKAMDELKQSLMSSFKMKDLGHVEQFLGMRVKQTPYNISIDLSKYIKEMLQTFGMSTSNPTHTPLPSGVNLSEFKATDDDADATLYRSIVGKLTYAANCARPDLATAVSFLSRYMQSPKAKHMEAAKHTLRYLRGTINLGIEYTRQAKLDLLGYCDADYAQDLQDRISNSGYVFMMSGGPITWACRKQKSVAVSSTESEYMALCLATKECVWILQLMDQMNLPLPKPVTLFEDNAACIAIAKNPVFHDRTKHISVMYHFTRHHLITKDIELHQISTELMVADMFTKSLARVKFQKLRELLGMKHCGDHTTKGSVGSGSTMDHSCDDLAHSAVAGSFLSEGFMQE